ncbi:unnamed protein product [Pelagomonas calceolata]|uniref:Uncharacterized protein n=1 Tax=Pelagomonas calceolata TaxID=35677 RepID=A0A8J2SM17_9STRA|nr:unnamed protein product [Pelagomonas calceolata]
MAEGGVGGGGHRGLAYRASLGRVLIAGRGHLLPPVRRCSGGRNFEHLWTWIFVPAHDLRRAGRRAPGSSAAPPANSQIRLDSASKRPPKFTIHHSRPRPTISE